MTLLASMTAVTSFDLNETKDMLHLAQAAYCDGVSPTQWNCKVCDNPVVLEKMIEHNGGKALVGYHSTYDALFVSFRGSENIACLVLVCLNAGSAHLGLAQLGPVTLNIRDFVTPGGRRVAR